MTEPLKRCNGPCREFKAESEFYRGRKGLPAWQCKVCQNACAKASYRRLANTLVERYKRKKRYEKLSENPEYMAAKRAYMESRRAGFVANGGCVDCGAKTRGYVRCETHRLKNNGWRRRKRERRAA